MCLAPASLTGCLYATSARPLTLGTDRVMRGLEESWAATRDATRASPRRWGAWHAHLFFDEVLLESFYLSLALRRNAELDADA
jgi:hypothetical protein